MPNHVLNEIVFRDLTDAKRDELLAAILSDDGKTPDFAILVPVPLYCWMGSVGERHEKAFKNNALDWCRQYWGTKWNAYDARPVEKFDGGFRLLFETAWRPPYGWLCAVFNKFAVPFDHLWLDEGASVGRIGRFEPKYLDDFGGEAWSERDATPEEHKRLHVLHFGVESFDDDDEDAALARARGETP